MPRLLGVAWIAAVIALGSPALGQPASEPSAAEVAIARAHFSEAEKLMKQGDWAAAIDKLEQVVAIKESAGVRFHLAMAQEQLGRLVDALNNLDRAGEIIRDGASEPETAKLIAPAREALLARIPTVTLKCAEPCPPNAMLTIDGKSVNLVLLGEPILLDPGEHRIELDAPGRGRWGTTVTLEQGAREEISAVLPKSSPRPESASTPPPTRDVAASEQPEPSRTRDYVLIGEGALTLIGLGVGIGFYIANGNAKERAESLQTSDTTSCAAPTDPQEQRRCADLRDAVDDQNRYAVLSTTGFVVAGLGAASLVATYVLWKPEPHAARTRRTPLLSASAAPGNYHLLLEGRF